MCWSPEQSVLVFVTVTDHILISQDIMRRYKGRKIRQSHREREHSSTMVPKRLLPRPESPGTFSSDTGAGSPLSEIDVKMSGLKTRNLHFSNVPQSFIVDFFGFGFKPTCNQDSHFALVVWF